LRLKVTRGSDPSGLFDYLLDPSKQTEAKRVELQATGTARDLILCATVPGQTSAQLALNFRRIARLNPNVCKTVAHYSVSLPEEDNGKVGLIEMRRISRMLLEQLGHGRSPYFAVEHHDTAHRHWHIAASTISYDGSWVDDSFERYRIRAIESTIEDSFSLKKTQNRPVQEIKNLSTGEYRLKRRTQKPVPKERLWAAIDDCTTRAKSLERFSLELRLKYPEISVHIKGDGDRPIGISFAIEGIAFSGRSLGRAYSLNGLRIYHGIEYVKSSKPFIEKIFNLSREECESLYLELETNAEKRPVSTAGQGEQINVGRKPQL
jgi:Relaxase/Mobilisation nuclease domain